MKHENAKQLWKRRLSMGLSLAMAVTMLPVGGLSANAEEGDAPALLKARSTSGVEGSTYTRNQPFIANVTGTTEDGAGRPYFNAPAFVVKETINDTEKLGECTILSASDTMLIAAAEGRFDQSKKAGGTDVIATVSKDNGATWTYSYPLRFPDSEGNAGKYATSINNPTLAVAADGTIYCVMNVTPTGVSSMASEGDGFTYPNVGTGYIDVNGTKRLALTDATEHINNSPADGNYNFYIGDFDATTKLAKIFEVDGDAETDHAVDEWYNIYQKNKDGAYVPMTQQRANSDGYNTGTGLVQQNVFYRASKYHVYNTSYIVCVTSADGLEWSAPQILNPFVKKEDGKSLVVAGGKGLTTSKGRIVFPVYRNNDGTSEDGSSSVIWLDKSTGGNNQWHRSGNIPNFAESTENEKGNWIGEGEIVELSDGKLRMVFRNAQGLISYADAQRNADNEFVFSDPVSTGTRSPENAHPSVISYLKPIDEKKGLLIAAPVGESRADGRIMTFLATGANVESEEENVTGDMTRVEGSDVPGSKDYFQNPCMDQFNAGDGIGLVWENGSGSVRFTKLGILDVVKEHYIPHITVDLKMAVGDVYERNYTVVGSAHTNGVTEKPMSGQDPDESVVSVELDKGADIEETVPALYPRSTADDGQDGYAVVGDGSLSNTFLHTDQAIADDIDKTIERAEFTITKATNEADSEEYVVYSALERRYFVGTDPKINFSAARPAHNIIITHKPEDYLSGITDAGKIAEDEFALIPSTKNRVNMFNVPKMRFDGQAGWNNTKSQLDGGFTLLQKLAPNETLEGDDAALELIPGYKKVTTVTPNEKYLIAFIPDESISRGDYFTDENTSPIIILYPRNSRANQTKLVFGTRKVTRRAKKHLTITAKGVGTARVVANHIIYNIECRDAQIELQEGGKRFFPNVTKDECSVTDSSVVKIEDFTLKEPALYDCERTADNSLDGYSKVPNTDINMEAAEFIFTSSGEAEAELYTIQSAFNDKYLINLPGAQYFGTEQITHEVKRVDGEGKESFEIRRKSNDNHNDRYVYFYYPKMGFDAVSEKNDNFIENGKFDFELLEKQDYPADLDQISGYRRVTAITSGRKYLITQTYHDQATNRDVRFILYPGNSIPTQSKMYGDTETPGVQLIATGKDGNSTTVAIDGEEYLVKITGKCLHDGYGRYYKGGIAASCEVDGYTGDLFCDNCDGLVEKGTAIPKGHDVAVWELTTPATYESAGTYSGTCTRCSQTATKPYTIEEYADDMLRAKIMEARNLTGANYTEKSLAPLLAALDKTGSVENTVAAKKALCEEIQDGIEGLVRKTDFNAAKNKLKPLLVKAKAAIGKDQAAFDPDVWSGLTAAVNAIKEDGFNLAELEDEAAIEALLNDMGDSAGLASINAAYDKLKKVPMNTIEEEKEEQERRELARKIKEAVSGAKNTYDAGQGDYTDDSWDAFEKAYREANVSDEELEEMTKEELQGLLDALTTAITNLKTNTNDGNSELEAAKAEIGKAVQAADAIVAGGQKNYTKASWDAFMAAYNAAKNAPANADAATLKKLAEALANAQKALQTEPAATLQKGYTEDVKGIRYEVLDPAKMTVKAKTGLNKKAKSITIPATVTLKGSFSCKVVEVGNKAFSGYKKATKITIGKNVTIIGKQAFMNTKNLKQIILKGKGLKKESSIKAKAFKGSTKKKVKIKWAKGTKNAQKKKVKKGLKRAGLKV